jgi:hypothetical protein
MKVTYLDQDGQLAQKEIIQILKFNMIILLFLILLMYETTKS